jgi:hypothetical protein
LGVPVSHPLRILRLVLLSDGMYAESHSHHATVHLRACQVGGLITFGRREPFSDVALGDELGGQAGLLALQCPRIDARVIPPMGRRVG